MKYNENDTIEEAIITESSIKEEPIDNLTTDKKENLFKSICKVINLRIKILEDSLADLKNAYTQLEDLYNERDN